MPDFYRLGIIGKPLGHSLSPLLHATLLSLAGLEGEYRKYELDATDLKPALKRFADAGVIGLNVTIPHKVAIMQHLQWLSPEAELARAVNTLVFKPAQANQPYFIEGHNTDIPGFLKGFSDTQRERLTQSHVLVLGAGGAARAVLTALIQTGVAEVTFVVRNPAKAIDLPGDGALIQKALGKQTVVHVVPLLALDSLHAYQGVINTTPVGMTPQSQESPLSVAQLASLPKDAFVYDLIYRPQQTQLLTLSSQLGLTTIGGLEMLLQQGVLAFELWTETMVEPAWLGIVREALAEAL